MRSKVRRQDVGGKLKSGLVEADLWELLGGRPSPLPGFVITRCDEGGGIRQRRPLP